MVLWSSLLYSTIFYLFLFHSLLFSQLLDHKLERMVMSKAWVFKTVNVFQTTRYPVHATLWGDCSTEEDDIHCISRHFWN